MVQVSSALAFRGIPLQAAYCGSKHAMVGLTESVITEPRHDHSKVRVSMVHTPALTTIQFDWVRTVLPHHPMPVAPIYQPQVGARAILHATEHPRRSMWVGISTAGTVLGNRTIPALLEATSAAPATTGSSRRRTRGPRSATTCTPRCPETTARGDFDHRAHDHSPELWTSLHRRSLAAGGVAAAAAAGLGWKLWR